MAEEIVNDDAEVDDDNQVVHLGLILSLVRQKTSRYRQSPGWLDALARPRWTTHIPGLPH